jgi:alpha-glucosidase
VRGGRGLQQPPIWQPEERAPFVPLGRAAVIAQGPASVRLRAGAATVEVAALAPDLFRVGLFGAGRPVEYPTEALARADWAPAGVVVEETATGVAVRTSQARAYVRLDPLRIRFEDTMGRVFAADAPEGGPGFLAAPAGRHTATLGAPARVVKQRPPTERYFGCGERTGGLEKTGTHLTFWSFDPPTEHTPLMDNLYVAVPFLLALDGGRAWGLFLDNAGHVTFDLGREQPDRLWLGTACGDLVYYVFAGPTPRAVVERYTELTGRTPLPPLWALGYHQSRWGYRSADELRALAREFRARDLPCDALYLDIDYMDGYRVFTWDPVRFPDPAGLLADLAAQGFHVVTILDPGIKVDEHYAAYRTGRAADVYCKTATGAEYRNAVWPGVCAFPDFTSPAARAWWAEQVAALVAPGVDGLWCDMNEPTTFIPSPSTFPPDVVHPGGGRPRLHAEVHNLYGSLMARATRQGFARQRPGARPFVISRAGYAGLQRDALHWTGDNSSTWEHLAMSVPQLANLGLSGLAWVGADVGGFWGDATGELLVRWVELGIFQPFCRNHSHHASRPQEPWAFGEPYESLVRRLLQLRQRLLPYLYTLFEECHRTGAPLLRPLLFAYPDDETAYPADDEFLLGDHLLVAPITRRGAAYRYVYLPQGTWCHFWTGAPVAGPAHVLAHAPLGEPAVYVRANAPLPLWPPMRHVGERAPDPLTVLVFPAPGAGAFTLYEDAGEGYAYEQGVYARTPLHCETTETEIVVTLGPREGRYPPPRTRVALEVRGLPGAPAAVEHDGAPDAAWAYADGTLHVDLPAVAAAQRVVVRW